MDYEEQPYNVKIYNSLAVTYRQYSGVRKKQEISDLQKESLKLTYTSKGLTSKASKTMKKYIKNWITALEAIQKYNDKGNTWLFDKLTFATVTLSAKQMHDEKYIKRHMLDRLITALRRKHGLSAYIWVMEAQENGNIHFHFMFNCYINWEFLRLEWNNIQRDNGYIEEYRKNQKEYHKNGYRCRHELTNTWGMEAQYKAYLEGVRTNWSNPNSTDIKRVQGVKNIEGYMSKYMTKGSDEEELEGHKWGCSDNIRSLKSFESVITYDYADLMNKICENKEIRSFVDKYYSVHSGSHIFSEIVKNKDIYTAYIAHQYEQYYIIYSEE